MERLFKQSPIKTVLVQRCHMPPRHFIIGIIAYIFSSRENKPFKNLDYLKQVKVLLMPPGEEVEITDKKELANHLKDLVIYQPDNSYKDYYGQAVIFIITMNDSSETEIMVYNPFLVIYGVGYKTKYEPCEALNKYANSLLEK